MTGRFDLTGKRALITGAARGIGAGAARALAEAGAAVMLTDILGDRLLETAASIPGATSHPADITDEAAVDALVAHHCAQLGGLDILVCSAGIAVPQTIDQTSLETWNRVLQVNLTGTFLACRAAVAAMRTQGHGGRIILLGSVVGHQGALLGHVAYAATKGGVHAFAKALARSTAADRITVNVVAPGLTDTEMLRGAHPPEEIAEISSRIPLGLAQADDVAAAVVYLASDAARQITGAVLDINGGMLMR
ncbi:MAG: SDR family oxidoreductase [Alphaproteobacteria bacterium]|nr:MAG: SDR family oxidoreductase [Alphaproteobacteria bacterium]